MKIKLRMLVYGLLCFSLIAAASIAKEKEKDNTKIKKTETTKQTTTEKSKTAKKDNSVNKDNTNTTNTNSSIKLDNLTSTPTSVAPQTGEQINWQVISSGGTYGTSTNYILSGTIGQTAIGIGTSTNYQLNSGYWQNFASGGGCCVGIRGNVDNDPGDNIDIADLVYFVTFSFGGGPAPVCFEEADVDGSLGLDIADIVYMVTYMFAGGPAPVSCP